MVRIIFVFLISISVAVVPAATTTAVSTIPVEMTAADHGQEMPCCAPDDCKGSIACAANCFNFIGVTFWAPILLPHVVEAAPPSLVDGILHEYVRSPPTHPPPGPTA